MIFFGEKVYCDVVLEKGNTVILLGKKSNTVILLQTKSITYLNNLNFPSRHTFAKKGMTAVYDCV
jgi:hypothetical protein